MNNTTPPGRLWIVGLGPGDLDLIPPLTWNVLAKAQTIIGYAGYVANLCGKDILEGKEVLSLPLGEERQRAALAVARARAGQSVVVISSGDPGIYGMASLVLESIAVEPGPAIDAAVIPGISAINAAASLLGAPLGHDFAVISLSDLLTPWEVIEKRLSAAAAADFVIVLMNPKSRERVWQLDRAAAILAEHRLPTTPVGVVRNAYRPEQTVTMMTLAKLPVAVVDMFTTVIIGNQATHVIGSKLITPRGYSNARSPSIDEKGR